MSLYRLRGNGALPMMFYISVPLVNGDHRIGVFACTSGKPPHCSSSALMCRLGALQARPYPQGMNCFLIMDQNSNYELHPCYDNRVASELKISTCRTYCPRPIAAPVALSKSYAFRHSRFPSLWLANGQSCAAIPM